MIEAYLRDCDGFDWQLVAKYVDFHEWAELGPETSFPLEVSLPCEVVGPVRRSDGATTDCVLISVESFRDGRFEVDRSLLIKNSA